jgi:hypothetical protein
MPDVLHCPSDRACNATSCAAIKTGNIVMRIHKDTHLAHLARRAGHIGQPSVRYSICPQAAVETSRRRVLQSPNLLLTLPFCLSRWRQPVQSRSSVLHEGRTSLIPETLRELSSDQELQEVAQRVQERGQKELSREERRKRQRSLDELGAPPFQSVLQVQRWLSPAASRHLLRCSLRRHAV